MSQQHIPEPWEKCREASPTVARFWRSVIRGEDSDCWEWTNSPVDGYGVFSITLDGREYKVRAHRFSYRIHYGGPMPECVCHTCDNRLCVNPVHLFAGDRTINNADMVAKGRNVPPGQKFGEDCTTAVLVMEDVVAIHSLKSRGWSLSQIAWMFGIDKSNVSMIVSGDRWREHSPARLRAAVNACAGIPTEALEAGVLGELVAALRGLLDTCGLIDDEYYARIDAAMSEASRTLARLEPQE